MTRPAIDVLSVMDAVANRCDWLRLASASRRDDRSPSRRVRADRGRDGGPADLDQYSRVGYGNATDQAKRLRLALASCTKEESNAR